MRKLKHLLVLLLITLSLNTFGQLPTNSFNSAILGLNADTTITNNNWEFGDKIIVTTILGDTCGIQSYGYVNVSDSSVLGVGLAIFGNIPNYEHLPLEGDTLIYSLYDTVYNVIRPCLNIYWKDSGYNPNSNTWYTVHNGNTYKQNGLYVPYAIIWDYNPPVVISEVSNEHVITYPNPADNFTNIRGLHDSDIQIFNMNGSMIYHTINQYGVIEIPTYNWANGVYIIKITNESKIITNQLIIQ